MRHAAGAVLVASALTLAGCGGSEPGYDGGERVTMVEATCRDGSEVVEYRIEGMGHVWPRASHGIDATRVMWDYFATHAR